MTKHKSYDALLEEVFFQKMEADLQKDQARLLELKKQCPEWFDKWFLYEMWRNAVKQTSYQVPEGLEDILKEVARKKLNSFKNDSKMTNTPGTSFDHLDIDEVFEIHRKKLQLQREGNLEGLIALKSQYHDIFTEENELKLLERAFHLVVVSQSPEYLDWARKEGIKKLIDLNFNEWHIGMLNDFLKPHESICFPNMDDISRTLVKESIAICLNAFGKNEEEISISDVRKVFPFLGFLINKIIDRTLDSKQELAKSITSKITKSHAEYQPGGKWEEWKNTLNNFESIEENIRHQFHILLDKMAVKFDKKEGFQHDLFRFCVYEVAEFVGLLIPRVGYANNETRDDFIDKVMGGVFWYAEITQP